MGQTFHFFKFTGKRAIILLVSLILLFSISTGATIAFIVAKSNSVNNSFIPPVFRINLQSSHSVKNVGNFPAYIRAYSVMTWASVEDEHTISSQEPVYTQENVNNANEFEIVFADDYQTNWFLAADGFYYYRHIVKPGEEILLVKTIYQLKEKPGYELRYELLTSAIQANTPDALEEAWPAVIVVGEDAHLEDRPMQNEGVVE